MLENDERTLIVDEARGQRLTAFDIEQEGALANRRVYVSMDDRPIGGASIDAEGGVWLGTPFNHEFVRLSPTNEVTDVIPVAPGHWAVGCEHGGPDGRTLFLMVVETTLEKHALVTSNEQDALSEARGRIETIEVPVPGSRWSHV
jgi:sugar lactone lactonase YvrE